MTTVSNKPPEPTARDAQYWAQPVARLSASDLPPGTSTFNVDGRRVVGPLQGFGKLWQKTYWIRLPGAQVTPLQVIKTWKEEFSSFWPRSGRFHAPVTGIAPGEVAALGLKIPGGLRLSTGVLVLYADEESFTFMCPEGHLFAGWITFSSYLSDGVVVAQAQVLIRPNDPLYEIGFRLFGSRREDKFWIHTLGAVASRFGVNASPEMLARCVDPRLQWRYAGNIRHNAAIHSSLRVPLAPFRIVGRLLQRPK